MTTKKSRRRATLTALSVLAALATLAAPAAIGAGLWREACAERLTVALLPAEDGGPGRLVTRWARRQGEAPWSELVFVSEVVGPDGPIALTHEDRAYGPEGGLPGRLAGRRAQRATARLATPASYPLLVTVQIQDGWDERWLVARIGGPEIEVEASPAPER